MIRRRLSALGMWTTGVVLVLGVWATCEAVAAEPARPVTAGAEGQRAFADLARYYQERQEPPPVDQVLQELESADPAERARSGKYLLALLAQSQADETNGRGNWGRQGLPAWGSGLESDAHAFRVSLADKLASRITAAEALDLAVWLLEQDTSPDVEKAGVTLLCRIKSQQVASVFQRLLRQPHPNQSVLIAVLEQVAERKLVGLVPEVRHLALHHRAVVRTAASKAAKALEVGEVPEYRPEEALTPWLDGLLKNIAAMVEGGVPQAAKWNKFTVTYPPSETSGEPSVASTRGWLLSEDSDNVQILSWLGSRYGLPKAQTKLEPSTLAETAQTLLSIRKKAAEGTSDADQDTLSPMGSFSAQFEPSYINVPEGLVAAWLYERGDKRMAAELLLPRINATEDDRWIGWAIRDMLGNVYHQEMLYAFADERDYERAIQLAKQLSQVVFDGYRYQERARQLAAQLARRGDDFNGFRLPTPDEWIDLAKKLGRQQQIEYLAARLRLLNCFQWGQPGGVDYSDPQTAKPGRALAEEQMRLHWTNPNAKHVSQVVNPYVQLCEMDIQVAELPALVPFLADEDFMPTYSFWRDFHPNRTLHQVNWAVAIVINDTAKRDLSHLEVFDRLDEEERKKHLETILDWCRRNAGRTEKDLLVESLAEVKDWRDFEKAARFAVQKHVVETLPVIAGRLKDFPHRPGDLIEICYYLDTDKAAPYARKLLTSEDQDVRFWSALILLRHGDRTKMEGLPELEAVLAKDEGRGWDLYPKAIEPLLAAKSDRAAALACGILKKEHFGLPDGSSGRILQRLFLAGQQECLDFLVSKLDSETPAGSIVGRRDGKNVERSRVEGDGAAETIAAWRGGRSEYDDLAPDDDRRTQRRQLKEWLKEQFALIKAGKEPKMTILNGPIEAGHAHFDAP